MFTGSIWIILSNFEETLMCIDCVYQVERIWSSIYQENQIAVLIVCEDCGYFLISGRFTMNDQIQMS